MHPYTQVINKVKQVNRQAALILAKQMPLLIKRGTVFSYIKLNITIPELSACFQFISTKQGSDYWWEICDKIS